MQDEPRRRQPRTLRKKNQTCCSTFSFLSLTRLLALWTIINGNVISSLNSVLSHRCPAHVPSLLPSCVPVYAAIVSENGTIERITTSFPNKRCYAWSFNSVSKYPEEFPPVILAQDSCSFKKKKKRKRSNCGDIIL